MDEQYGPMWISKNMLGQPVSPRAIRIGEPVKGTVALRVLDSVIQIALFFVAERFTVANEQLKIACVRLVHIRIINFVDDAVAQGEPNPATRMISGAKTLLGARCPTWSDAGCTECDRMFR